MLEAINTQFLTCPDERANAFGPDPYIEQVIEDVHNPVVVACDLLSTHHTDCADFVIDATYAGNCTAAPHSAGHVMPTRHSRQSGNPTRHTKPATLELHPCRQAHTRASAQGDCLAAIASASATHSI